MSGSAAAKLYANSHDLKEPLVLPIFGDFTGLPPAIILTGTRDLQLSDAVNVHRKVLRSGGIAELHVFEGQSHRQYQADLSAPETREAFLQIAQFFDHHLGPMKVGARALFGRWASHWRVIPPPLIKRFKTLTTVPADSDSPLECALARFGAVIEERLLIEWNGGQGLAT
jgi:alpha/beta hydrolase family protein